jgi:hypothetical protein
MKQMFGMFSDLAEIMIDHKEIYMAKPAVKIDTLKLARQCMQLKTKKG